MFLYLTDRGALSGTLGHEFKAFDKEWAGVVI